MRKTKYIIMGIMTTICLLAIILNQDMEFTIISIIGYVVMIGLSFVKYEWIEKYYVWILGAFISLLVIINCTPLGVTVNGINSLKIGRYGISNNMILIMSLPLVAVLMNKVKLKIPFWILVGITAVAHILIRPNGQWETFISKEGDASYIYEQISWFSKGSKFIGRSDLFGDMTKYLPEYRNGTILTAYGVEYGIAVKILVCILLISLIGVIIYQMVKKEISGNLFAIGCAGAIGFEILIIILQNIPAIPYKGLVTFLPFFSKGLGSLIMCYALMGLVLCVYNTKSN